MTANHQTLDARDVPVTCSQPEVLNLYEKALGQYQSYIGDPLATIEEALRRAPDFTLGHLFRACALMMMSERRFVPEAQSSVNAATALLPSSNARERALTAATASLVKGDWDVACAGFDRVLVDYPRDAFAIQSAHLMDFFRGDSLNLRTRISRVLPHWNASLPGYSYILGMHAFGLEECNQYSEAEETGRRALELQPKDAWAVHAVTHVMEMQGRVDDGIRWLESRTDDWASNNSFAFHNWWHLALFYLDRGKFENVLSMFDSQLHAATPDYILQLLDGTSLLWRLHLERANIGDRANAIADNWAGRLQGERGFYAFNDLHAMMAFVLAGRDREADELIAGMEWTAANGTGINLMMTRDIGLPLCRAFRAFGQERYSDAVALIEPVRDIANRFGGSHAQRDVLTLTMIEAAIRGGQHRRAQHYIAERTVLRPGGNWGPRLARSATL
ncbi:MAG TPA: tetratricopeptide repeat protein [Terriglobia bacterium]|nr:tetratricopeptide repeat protein [Terriglobia bacterium]